MLGSKRKEFAADDVAATHQEVFSVKLPGRTLWGWRRRDEAGDVVACSEALFADYVACLCDAHQGR